MRSRGVVDSETYEHLRVRLARETVNDLLTRVSDRMGDSLDDPLVMGLVPCAAFVQETFVRHPVDKRGRCKKRSCRRWRLLKRVCPSLEMLLWYLTADTVTLWWRVLSETNGYDVDLQSTREWLDECGVIQPAAPLY